MNKKKMTYFESNIKIVEDLKKGENSMKRKIVIAGAVIACAAACQFVNADAAQAAFSVIKETMQQRDQAPVSKGKIVLATVKGDIHDIGKNIVRVILENYGYDVLDLGRDVDPERVVEAVRQTGAKLVGLSALMTTTVPNMQATIEALHAAHLDCKVMVGGAVLTPDYARDIGADYYCKDAKASADLAKQLLG